MRKQDEAWKISATKALLSIRQKGSMASPKKAINLSSIKINNHQFIYLIYFQLLKNNLRTRGPG
jgi:hypothetical protein